MSDSESNDKLWPHQIYSRHFNAPPFSDSNDSEELRDYKSSDGSSIASACSSLSHSVHASQAHQVQNHVLVACCSYSGILPACDIYCGREFDDWIVLQTVDNLQQSANLLVVHGCKLFTENYYTSVNWQSMCLRSMAQPFVALSAILRRNYAQSMMCNF